jgi:hypothetical protein
MRISQPSSTPTLSYGPATESAGTGSGASLGLTLTPGSRFSVPAMETLDGRAGVAHPAGRGAAGGRRSDRQRHLQSALLRLGGQLDLRVHEGGPGLPDPHLGGGARAARVAGPTLVGVDGKSSYLIEGDAASHYTLANAWGALLTPTSRAGGAPIEHFTTGGEGAVKIVGEDRRSWSPGFHPDNLHGSCEDCRGWGGRAVRGRGRRRPQCHVRVLLSLGLAGADVRAFLPCLGRDLAGGPVCAASARIIGGRLTDAE